MKKIFLTLVMLVFLWMPQITSATCGTGTGETPCPSGGGNISVTITNPLKAGSSLPAIITAILQNVVMPLATVFIVLAIVYAGFKYVMAQGNPKEITDANQGLLYVLIGAAVLLGATGISAALKGTLCQLITC